MPAGDANAAMPGVEQALLLRAALCEGDQAREAWTRWKTLTDFDRADPASRHLCPLLYRNLTAQGVSDPNLAVLKGHYRMTWSRNETEFRYVAGILRAFHAAGIRTMILKGAALAVLHYPAAGLRPMGDLDVLVPTDRAIDAMRVLGRLGWTPLVSSPESVPKTYPALRHAHAFTHPAGHLLDLHWHLLFECCYPGADDDFWSAAIPTALGGEPTCALGPADELLHTCVHGSWWAPVSSLRWVADATMILRTAGSAIEWPRLIAQAKARELVVAVRTALEFLRATMQAPIPAEVIDELRRAPTTRAERLAYALKTSRRGALGQLRLHIIHHRRLVHTGGSEPGMLSLARYFQGLYGLERLWHVPFYGVAKGVQRVKRLRGR